MRKSTLNEKSVRFRQVAVSISMPTPTKGNQYSQNSEIRRLLLVEASRCPCDILQHVGQGAYLLCIQSFILLDDEKATSDPSLTSHPGGPGF